MTVSILVTGATGFVGSHVLEVLMHRDDVSVIAACRDKTRLLPSYKGEVREGDLRNEAYLEQLLDGIDVICHCAAWTSLWGHEQESEELYLQPSLRLIDKAIEKGIKRFINTSTTSAAAPGSRLMPAAGVSHVNSGHICVM